jgi:hypothetical protein
LPARCWGTDFFPATGVLHPSISSGRASVKIVASSARNRHQREAVEAGLDFTDSGIATMFLLHLTVIIIALIGAVLAAAGAYLVILGGSVYYMLTGVGFLLTALLLALRRRLALLVFGAMIVLSLAWAVWEVGFDWWQLGPRGGIIVLIGIWLSTPWLRRKLVRDGASEERPAAAWPVAVPVLLAVIIAGYSARSDHTRQCLDLEGGVAFPDRRR